MTGRFQRHAVSAIFAAVVVLGAGCGSDGDDTGARSAGDGDDTAARSAGDGDDTAAGGAGEVQTSPIQELLGQPSFGLGGHDDGAEAALIEKERGRQEIIAACMREEGFEYTEADPAQSIGFAGESADGLEWGTEEWTAKYGFAMSTTWFSQAEVGPDLVGYDDSGTTETTFEDPNQEYVDSLSDAEQEAFYAALYGDQEDFPVFDETLSEEEREAAISDDQIEPQGCQGEAYAQDSSSAFYNEFSDQLSEMYERIQADPRLVEAQAKVESCLADKGLGDTNIDDFFEEAQTELNAIESEVGGSSELSEAEIDSMTDEELNEFFNASREFTEDAKARLGELQRREIELALAAAECGGSFGEIDSLYAEVTAEYEQKFVDANADALAKFKGDS